MKLYWISILLITTSLVAQTSINFLAIETGVDAHDYAIHKLKDSRAVTTQATTPFMYCRAASGMPCQSFEIADDGSYIGHNLSEHDALLLLVAENEMSLARGILNDRRQLKIRSDPPPPLIRYGSLSFNVEDRDIWNAYVLGDTNCKYHDIRTVNTNPNKRITILHEMMHVATNCSNEKGLHRLIQQMSPKLLKVMRENPEAIAYIMQHPEYEK